MSDESQSTALKVLASTTHRRLPRPLPLSLYVRARAVFFSHYVDGGTRTYDFIRTLDSPVKPVKPVDEGLSTTIDAVSLAYFFVQTQAPTVLQYARKKYVCALGLTNSALQSPELVKEDATLLSALLLDLYEKMTNHYPQSSASWASHAKGALTLVEMRGREQFCNPAGIRMLVSFSTKLVISCVATGSRVPAELVALRTYLENFLNAGDPKWRLTGLMVHFANLRADIDTNKMCYQSLLDLDAKFSTLVRDMPPAWRYNTVFLEKTSPRIYGHYHHVYKDHHITQTWNVLRLARILLNEYIGESPRLSDGDGSPLDSATVTLASEICASVPPYVETLYERLGGSPSVQVCQVDVETLVLLCYTLLFPLYVAARSPVSPPALKTWVIAELHFMGGALKIRNAELVARVLDEGGDTDPWSVYGMLGGYAFSA